MASQLGITLIKKFTYRGNTNEEYSNTYHFTGAVPSDSAAWKTFADLLIAQEKTVYTGDVSVVRAYGYATDNPADDSVWTWDYGALGTSVAGTLLQGTGVLTPGDDAVWCRWKTSRTNTNGKPIYLRKYFHVAVGTSGTGANRDSVLPAQTTALQAFAAKMHDGTFVDARTITARGHTDVILSHGASIYITTRTLKRRGKRPGS